jgi:hypothetical protein
MSSSDLFAICESLGIHFGEKATAFAPILDELEERVWLAQEFDESPPLWVEHMKAAVGRKLGSVMGDTE